MLISNLGGPISPFSPRVAWGGKSGCSIHPIVLDGCLLINASIIIFPTFPTPGTASIIKQPSGIEPPSSQCILLRFKSHPSSFWDWAVTQSIPYFQRPASFSFLHLVDLLENTSEQPHSPSYLRTSRTCYPVRKFCIHCSVVT